MSHLAKPPPLKPLSVNGLTIFRLPEPPLVVLHTSIQPSTCPSCHAHFATKEVQLYTHKFLYFKLQNLSTKLHHVTDYF